MCRIANNRLIRLRVRCLALKTSNLLVWGQVSRTEAWPPRCKMQRIRA